MESVTVGFGFGLGFGFGWGFFIVLIWCSQLNYSVSSKHGILKDQVTFLFLFENEIIFFFHAPVSSSLFRFRFCELCASTYTYGACVLLAQGRHMRSCHHRSFPSSLVYGEPSPQGVCTAPSAYSMCSAPCYSVLTVYFDNNAPTIE